MDEARAWLVRAAVAALVIWLGVTYGWARAAVAAVMFVLIVAYGMRLRRKFVSIPPEPEIADVSEYGLKYVCSMCGLELKVEVAAKDKAPTHCGEPMVLVRTGGRAPLRPV